MNIQTHRSNLNTEKIAVYATIIGVLFIVIGALLLFIPKIIAAIMINSTLELSVSYNWVAIAILTTGGLLNMLSFKLNSTNKQ